ncbi:MAG: FtsQ-type POTRA domain-containing protein [Candidatus Magasanikbacteria bacterium]|nr:FtsQ-type POTRA domain-containing protein [Candidatus Magasanikbacteria bacterium]
MLRDYSPRAAEKHKPKLGWRERRARKKRAQEIASLHQTLAGQHGRRQLTSTPSKVIGLKKYFYILAACFFLWVTLMVYLPFFRITTILVETSEEFFKKEELVGAVKDQIKGWLVIPKNNYFFVDTKKIADNLARDFQFLSAVDVQKKFPNSLALTATQKIPAAIVAGQAHTAYADKNGQILKILETVSEVLLLSTSTSSSPPLLNGERGNEIKTDPTMLRKRWGAYPVIISLSSELKMFEYPIDSVKFSNLLNSFDLVNQSEGLKASSLEWDESNGGVVRLNTARGWFVIMDLKKDLKTQADHLLTLLAQNPKITSYIDLRFGDRVYWK